MAESTGFLEFTRELPNKRPVQERVHDFKEFIHTYEVEKLNQQAARCMDCGVPFCHHGCPLGNLIPEFNYAVYKQNWKEAYEILSSTNNFPEFTGRVCPAPCESSCVLGINQPPVAIEEIEKHIIELAFEKGLVQPHKTTTRTGKHIAIVGSGPAGLAAAAQLNHAGHTVTVFERDDEAGGLLRYGIPDFKLEKWVVERRINLMKEEGVIFQCNAEVGVNVPFNDLLRKFDAIVLAGGSTIARDLNILGRQLNGISFAMDFLKQQNKRVSNKDAINNLTAEGKHVVVIGGGDTGSALYVNVDPISWFGLSLRSEYLSDYKSVLGFDGNVFANTLSANFKIDNLTIIPELRIDNAISSPGLFTKSNGDAIKSTSGFLLAAVYRFFSAASNISYSKQSLEAVYFYRWPSFFSGLRLFTAPTH